jgi:hypothetical protein
VMKTGSTWQLRGTLIRGSQLPQRRCRMSSGLESSPGAGTRPAIGGVIRLEKGTLQIIDVSTGAPVSPEFGPAAEKGQVDSLALSPDAEWLVTATSGGEEKGCELQLWATRDGKPAEVPPMRGSEPLQIQDVSPDGKKVLAIAGGGQAPAKLQLWEFGRESYPLGYKELTTLTDPKSFWPQVWGRGQLAAFCSGTGLVAAVSAEPAAWTPPSIQSRFSIRCWHADTAQELSRSIRSAGGLSSLGVCHPTGAKSVR